MKTKKVKERSQKTKIKKKSSKRETKNSGGLFLATAAGLVQVAVAFNMTRMRILEGTGQAPSCTEDQWLNGTTCQSCSTYTNPDCRKCDSQGKCTECKSES